MAWLLFLTWSGLHSVWRENYERQDEHTPRSTNHLDHAAGSAHVLPIDGIGEPDEHAMFPQFPQPVKFRLYNLAKGWPSIPLTAKVSTISAHV